MEKHDGLILECLTAKTFNLPENMKEAKRKTYSITGKKSNEGRTKACGTTPQRPKKSN